MSVLLRVRAARLIGIRRARTRCIGLEGSQQTRVFSVQTHELEEELLKRGATAMLDAYQRYGHYEAQLDPLGLRAPRPRAELSASRYFPARLLDRPWSTPPLPSLSLPPTVDTGSKLEAHLRHLHCGKVGFEFAHLDEAEERDWLTNRMSELFGQAPSSQLTPSERLNAAALLVQAETLEGFMAKKFPSFKRYSGEGAEAMQAALDAIFRYSLGLGTQEAVVGMPHRGRLAFLVSQLHFPARRLFFKVPGQSELDPSVLEGVVDDVTSHLAASVDKAYPGHSAKLHVSLLHNPSHLELIGAVAAGKTRAKLAAGSRSALCVQVHGDAAMAGQGVVPETLSLAGLPGFTVGGSLHLVVNNQLGFTTEEQWGRSSRYCTDVAKMTGVPVLHVNGESVDHVMLACKLAVEFRHRFGKDVMLDLVAYRKHGHNEVDEPGFTQPVMYREIRREDRPSPARLYWQQLEQEGLATADKLQKLVVQLEAHLEGEFAAAQSYDITANPPDHLRGKWVKLRHASGEDVHKQILTGAPIEVLQHVGLASVLLPLEDGDRPQPFRVHPRLDRTFIQARLKLLEDGRADWSTAEALALGSLLAQGFDVRLCGQDVQRGTFSHRHLVLTDQETGERYCPLSHVAGSRGRLEVVNSNLSELAVLGFELGYSWEDPRNMVVWEAQFGDFANGAQMVIDTFISGCEAKWLRQTGLVLLLPHGYDGAGPEHSSCRLERFLQLCDAPGVAPADVDVPDSPNTNMVVINPTTPANYFHALRRQQLRPFRKPMVVVAPKTLLRHPSAVSSLSDMTVGTSFHPVLATDLSGQPLSSSSSSSGVSSVVLCSGKVYYDLLKAASSSWPDVPPSSVAVVRLEELAPFPATSLRRLLRDTFPGASSFTWVQEEPLNAGAWSFVSPHIDRILRQEGRPGRLAYCGRPALPTPAVGLSKANASQWAQVTNSLHETLRGRATKE